MISDNRLILGLVGRKGSGKGTIAKILQERYGALTYRYSDVLRDTLSQLFIEKSRENLIKLSEAMRSAFGQDILEHAMKMRIASTTAPFIVLDGIRRLGDLEGLESLGDFKLVSVEAPLEVRFERLQNRGENAGETTRTLASFIEMEHAPTEITISEVEKHAWKTLRNNGTPEDLLANLDALMTELDVARVA